MTRENARAGLAELLDIDPGMLLDPMSLRDGLALDSLTMLRVVTWMEAQGCPVTAEDMVPDTVGELLSRLENPRPKIRIGGVPGIPERFTAVGLRDPLVPVLETAALRLTPMIPDDLGFLYALAIGPETGFRWRYRGSVPSFDQFKAQLHTQVLLQFVVRRVSDNRPVGHVVAYGDELSLRHTYIGAVFTPDTAGTGLAAQAVSLFAQHLFHTFPLTKVYLEIPGMNWAQVQSGQGGMLHVEGVLRDHDYYAGRLWDKYICALYPSDFSITNTSAAVRATAES